MAFNSAAKCSSPASPIEWNAWTDEDAILLMEDFMLGRPLPSNVIADFNPYQYPPSNLPDGIGYFSMSEVKRDTELGSWKAKGDPHQILSNFDITGWKTTLEFYKGQAHEERRTNWVMHEYRITQNELSNNSDENESGTFCRLFHSEEQILDHVIQPIHRGALPQADKNPNGGTFPQSASNPSQGLLTNEIQEMKGLAMVPLSVAERHKCVLDGDYLELDELDYRLSPSTSDNSSFATHASDEWFDSDMLLKELNDDKERQEKAVSSKYMVSSLKPDEIVMSPPTLGKLLSGCSQKSDYTLPPYSMGRQNTNEIGYGINYSDEITSSSSDVVGSSNHVTEKVACASQNAVPSDPQNAANSQHVKDRRRKNGVYQMKKLNKYFCCIKF